MKFLSEIKMEITKGIIHGLAIGLVIIIAYLGFVHFCYHLDGQHFTLGDNYTVLEERITDFFGNTIIEWERKVPKQPMEFVIYEKAL